MICPACSSTSITGPIATATRGIAAMRCTRCSSTFDAYALFGASASTSISTAVAA